jgi:arylsulfatase A-like enzyme
MTTARRSAFWPTVWLALALGLAKAAHWSIPEPTAKRLGEYATDLGVSAYQDVLFAIGFGLLGAAALRLVRGSRAERFVWWIFLALAAFCVFYAVASVQIFAFLRSPLTYALLYVAGDMKNMRSSIGNFVSPALLVALVGAPLGFLALSLGAARRPPPPSSPRRRGLLALGALALGILLLLAYRTAEGPWRDRDDVLILKNPHWAFLSTTVTEILGGGGVRMDVPYPPEFLAEFEPRPQPPSRGVLPRPRNVLLVVLESTGSRYLSLYGSPYPTTKRLEAEAQHALVFDSFYTHVGMTANATAALLLSIYPYMTWREYTAEYPHLPGVTLAEVAHEQGLRTAFLHTGDLSYVGQREFLAHRGFDVIRDIKDLGNQWIASWGGDDRALVDGTLSWIDEDRAKPFFAVAWTTMSHHPYEPRPGAPLVDFFKGGALPDDDYDLGRYLNTVQQVDGELGRLFDGLRERGLAEDTLVVVTGDHGEGFGAPHRSWGHGFRLYQEAIQVPLVIANPRLYPAGRRLATVGGHVDLNPTVTDLMGWPASGSWQGKSLFDPSRSPRTYFYAAHEDYLLGVREGDWKYIYNATRGREELYDLASDPEESQNRAAGEGARGQALRQRLAAWKDSTGRRLAKLREETPVRGR